MTIPKGHYERAPLSAETRQKISLSMMGENHHRWLEDPPYDVLHRWVRDHKTRTGICEHCGAAPSVITARNGIRHSGTEFANISGEYKRDVADYLELCRSCHRKYDKEEGDS